ncbi:MAG TPA: tetratricopeptide repeat protein [Bryobacteraceae bacterium]|jgi:tetratricopeptide (TPR) repeat protein|nr:tetratricopeptide repeat protein [Bryobacteraceae bacterium]
MMPGISFAAFLVLAAALTSVRDQGIAAFEQGRYSEALPQLQQAAKDSSDMTAATFLALTQAALGDCQTALPSLTAERNVDPALGRLAGIAAVKCANALGQNSKAFDLLDSLVRKYPNDADVLYLAAKAHIKAFNDATYLMFQRTPASYRVHELSAEIFEVENRYAEAIGEYRKAIELNPSAPELHYRLGRAILLDGHNPDAYAKAVAEFQAELKISPEDAACEFQIAQIKRVQGDPDGAKSHLERAVALSPEFTHALVALARIYAQEKKYEKAIPLLTKATAIEPDNEAAHYALLTAYRDTGDMDKAKREKETLDKLQKPPDGEFSNFLKKLGEKPPEP